MSEWRKLGEITSGRMRAVWDVAHDFGFTDLKSFWDYAHSVRWTWYDVLRFAYQEA